MLRKVKEWKAAKLKLEEKRIEELRRAADDDDDEDRDQLDDHSADLLHELHALKIQIDSAEATLEAEKRPESDSDLEGYASEELHSEDEDDPTDKKEGEADSVKSVRVPVTPASSDDTAPLESDGAHRRTKSRPHHHQPTENWTQRTKDVKLVYDPTPGIKYSEDFSSVDAAAGPPPPFIADHSKEELLFSRILAIEFSRCGKYLAMVGDGPKYPLAVWEISQKEMIGAQRYMNQPAHRLEIRPTNGPLTVITLGKDHLRIWEIKTKFLEHHHTFSAPLGLQDKVSGETLVTRLVEFMCTRLTVLPADVHISLR
jgi:hypothetical protein